MSARHPDRSAPTRDRPDRRVAVARPSFGPEEEAALVEVVRSGWVTQGPRVESFERRFAERVGAADAVAVSSGTTALFLSLHASGIGPGDEVIVPSLSFIATANAVTHCGATPVFAEVDPRTYNLDPARVEEAVSSRTRAILLVHQLGLPADLDAIEAIARAHGLEVIEDAACAVGSVCRGREIGSSGRPVCFSFHPRKVIVTGEGGMIATGSSDLGARLRRLRHQGMSISDIERHRADRVVIEDYPEVGYNFRMSDLHAALGLVQLDKLDRLLAARREVAGRYDAGLATLPRVEPPFVPAWAHANYQSYIVRLDGADEKERDRVLDLMHARGVATRRGLMAIHLEPPYRAGAGRGGRIAGSLAHTEAAAAQTLVLPMHAELSPDDTDYVLEQLEATLGEVFP